MTSPTPEPSEVISEFDDKHPDGSPERTVTDPGELTRPLTADESAAIADEYESLKGGHNG